VRAFSSPRREGLRPGAVAPSLAAMAAPAPRPDPVAAPPPPAGSFSAPNSSVPSPPIPSSFGDYLRSFGPAIIIVLTWLGAGDVVDMGVAGANYGYSLMWVLVAALVFRYVFVSLIARYQLCNQHGEGVLDGLVRLHRWYAPALFVAAIVMGHVYGSYMTVGIGETCRNTFRFGQVWQWALACNSVAFLLVFRASYKPLERAFLFFLAVLSVSFLGSALWVGFNPAELANGLWRVELPAQRGHFNPALVAVAMIGAVGGSLMNLVYPYFLEAKGWRGPAYLKVQRYDFLLGVVVMIVLNLAVWVLGAELLFPDRQIKTLDDLPQLLSTTLGEGGRLLFYAGIFSAIYTSIIGHAAGLGSLGSHAWLRMHTPVGQPITTAYQRHPMYRAIVIVCLATPLIWTVPGMPDFVTLTLVANSAQVVLLPVLAGGLWWITARAKYIGEAYKNRVWENIVMALLFALAVYGGISSARSIAEFVGK
jgi:Mn2+/Fe2+ NRAMP family transporter